MSFPHTVIPRAPLGLRERSQKICLNSVYVSCYGDKMSRRKVPCPGAHSLLTSQGSLFSSSQMLLFHQAGYNCASSSSLDNMESVGKIIIIVVVVI